MEKSWRAAQHYGKLCKKQAEKADILNRVINGREKSKPSRWRARKAWDLRRIVALNGSVHDISVYLPYMVPCLAMLQNPGEKWWTYRYYVLIIIDHPHISHHHSSGDWSWFTYLMVVVAEDWRNCAGAFSYFLRTTCQERLADRSGPAVGGTSWRVAVALLFFVARSIRFCVLWLKHVENWKPPVCWMKLFLMCLEQFPCDLVNSAWVIPCRAGTSNCASEAFQCALQSLPDLPCGKKFLGLESW